MRNLIKHIDEDMFIPEPAKVKVCQCEQCKAVKNKRKNRNKKAVIKRMTNRQRRHTINGDKMFNFYWA